jgi:hypothetical protein
MRQAAKRFKQQSAEDIKARKTYEISMFVAGI